MTTITTRAGKGSPLTNNEVDANFTGLNSDKVETSGDSMTGDLSFGDNNKVVLGAGSDLKLYHTGSHSYIDESGTGNLYIGSNNGGGVYIQGSGETLASFVDDGAVTLNFDNAPKVATTNTGIDVTGTVVSDGIVSDGVTTVRVTSAGATAEGLTVYNTENANNSQVDVYFGSTPYDTTGRGLRIEAGRDSGADGIATFYSVDQSEHSDYEAIKILTDGGVTLSHLGNNKLATSSTGIDVTGGVTTNANSYLNGLRVGGADTGNTIYQPTGELSISSASGSIFLKPSGTTVLTATSTGIDVNGGVAVSAAGTRRIDISNTSLADTGEMATLQWDANADLTFQGRASDGTFKANWYRIEASASDGLADAHRFYTDSSVERMAITSTGIDVTGSVTADGGTFDGTVLMNSSNELQFFNANYGIKASTGLEIKTGDFTRFLEGSTEHMIIASGGNVGIGESDPDSTLTVKGASHTNFQVKSNSESTKAFIQTVQDSDVRIGSSTNHPVSFYQNGTARMSITSAGASIAGNLIVDAGVNGTIDFGNVTSAYGRLYADSTGTYVGSYTADPLILRTNNTERMRINSSGSIDVHGDAINQQTSAAWYIRNRVSGGSLNLGVETSVGALYYPIGISGASNVTIFKNATTEIARFASNGYLGIDNNLPSDPLTIGDGDVSSMGLGIKSTNTGNNYIHFGDTDSASSGRILYDHNADNMQFNTGGTMRGFFSGSGLTVTANSGSSSHHFTYNENGGEIQLYNAAGNIATLIDQVNTATRILELQNGSTFQIGHGSTNTTGIIEFRSAGFGLAGVIDANANWTFNTSNTSGTAGAGVKITRPSTSGNDDGKLMIVGESSTSAQDGLQIYSTGASAYRFFVNYAGSIFATSTSITAISDESLKENIRDLDKGLDTVLALQPRRFDWKNGDGNDIMGFVAQEVEEVMPELVHDYKYSEAETKLGLKMGDMVPTLVKAIQDQQEIIENLKSRIEQLEGAN